MGQAPTHRQQLASGGLEKAGEELGKSLRISPGSLTSLAIINHTGDVSSASLQHPTTRFH